MLKLLEEEKQNKVMSSVEVDLPLFAVLQEKEEKEQEQNPVIEELGAIDVDALSPREAMEVLYKLKEML